MRIYLKTIVFLLLLLSLGACKKKAPSPEAISSRDPQTLALKLKEGVKINLNYVDLEKGSDRLGTVLTREVSLKNPGGAEGMTLQWREAMEGPETMPSLQGQVITLDENGALPNPLRGLISSGGGQLSLPNLTLAHRMTLPAFWPSGDLYLSDSSGIWLSDVAFEEIKREGKTQWDAGLFYNPLLGPAEDLRGFRRALALLENEIHNEKAKMEKSRVFKALGKGRFTLKVDGKDQTVEVVEIGNWLARLTVLDNAQNPLILKFQLAPEAGIGEILFSPLGRVKGLVEYQVVGFKNPKENPL